MKILISTGGYSARHIVLDASHAALAAGLLANATIYEDNGSTGDGKVYKLGKEEGLTITYANDKSFEELPEAVIHARKATDEANSARWKEYTRAQNAEKELAEVKAALEALKSVTTCQVQEPEVLVEEPQDADRDEEE